MPPGTREGSTCNRLPLQYERDLVPARRHRRRDQGIVFHNYRCSHLTFAEPVFALEMPGKTTAELSLRFNHMLVRYLQDFGGLVYSQFELAASSSASRCSPTGRRSAVPPASRSAHSIAILLSRSRQYDAYRSNVAAQQVAGMLDIMRPHCFRL